MSKRKKMSFLLISFSWLSYELWSINKLKQRLWCAIFDYNKTKKCKRNKTKHANKQKLITKKNGSPKEFPRQTFKYLEARLQVQKHIYFHKKPGLFLKNHLKNVGQSCRLWTWSFNLKTVNCFLQLITEILG